MADSLEIKYKSIRKEIEELSHLDNLIVERFINIQKRKKAEIIKK